MRSYVTRSVECKAEKRDTHQRRPQKNEEGRLVAVAVAATAAAAMVSAAVASTEPEGVGAGTGIEEVEKEAYTRVFDARPVATETTQVGMPTVSTQMPSSLVSNRKLDVEERSSIYLFEKSTPGVVFVTNVGMVRDSFTLALQDVPQGAGSGLVYDGEGHVVTNYHVIKGAREVTVTFVGEVEPVNAKIVGFDADKDIAVLQLDQEVIKGVRTRIRPLDIGSSNDLLVGQKVFAIGNPFGLVRTLGQHMLLRDRHTLYIYT